MRSLRTRNPVGADGDVDAPVKPLDLRMAQVRSGNKINFNRLKADEKSDFYDRASEEWLNLTKDVNDPRSVTYYQAASTVAHRFKLTIAEVDRVRIKNSVSNRVKAKRKFESVVPELDPEGFRTPVKNSKANATTARNMNRVGKGRPSGRKPACPAKP